MINKVDMKDLNPQEKQHFEDFTRLTDRKYSIKTPIQPYTGWLLVERGFGFKTEAGLIFGSNAETEQIGLVLAIGSEVKFGIQPRDFCIYQQGVIIKGSIKGPNGGQLFFVTEREVGVVIPFDGRKIEKLPEEKKEEVK
jgi:hypothetical protein